MGQGTEGKQNKLRQGSKHGKYNNSAAQGCSVMPMEAALHIVAMPDQSKDPEAVLGVFV